MRYGRVPLEIVSGGLFLHKLIERQMLRKEVRVYALSSFPVARSKEKCGQFNLCGGLFLLEKCLGLWNASVLQRYFRSMQTDKRLELVRLFAKGGREIHRQSRMVTEVMTGCASGAMLPLLSRGLASAQIWSTKYIPSTT